MAHLPFMRFAARVKQVAYSLDVNNKLKTRLSWLHAYSHVCSARSDPNPADPKWISNFYQVKSVTKLSREGNSSKGMNPIQQSSK